MPLSSSVSWSSQCMIQKDQESRKMVEWHTIQNWRSDPICMHVRLDFLGTMVTMLRMYNNHIAVTLSFWRWLHIKREKNFCNNDSTIKDKSSPNYDPTYEYDCIFKCIIHNAKLSLRRRRRTWLHYKWYGKCVGNIILI